MAEKGGRMWQEMRTVAGRRRKRVRRAAGPIWRDEINCGSACASNVPCGFLAHSRAVRSKVRVHHERTATIVHSARHVVRWIRETSLGRL